jgi:hypothetical protein
MQKCLQKTLFHYTILPFNLGMTINKNWEVKGHPWFNPDRPIQDTSSFKGSKFQMKKYVTKLRRDANKLVFFADILSSKQGLDRRTGFLNGMVGAEHGLLTHGVAIVKEERSPLRSERLALTYRVSETFPLRPPVFTTGW